MARTTKDVNSDRDHDHDHSHESGHFVLRYEHMLGPLERCRWAHSRDSEAVLNPASGVHVWGATEFWLQAPVCRPRAGPLLSGIALAVEQHCLRHTRGNTNDTRVDVVARESLVSVSAARALGGGESESKSETVHGGVAGLRDDRDAAVPPGVGAFTGHSPPPPVLQWTLPAAAKAAHMVPQPSDLLCIWQPTGRATAPPDGPEPTAATVPSGRWPRYPVMADVAPPSADISADRHLPS